MRSNFFPRSFDRLVLFSVVASLAVLLSSCGSKNARVPVPQSTAVVLPAAGVSVTAQIRRDHLGAASGIPNSLTAGEINGAVVSVSGRFVAMDERWVVLKRVGGEAWIPRESLLMLTFSK